MVPPNLITSSKLMFSIWRFSVLDISYCAFFSIGTSFFWLRITHGAQSSGWGLWRCYASFCSYKYRPRFKIL